MVQKLTGEFSVCMCACVGECFRIVVCVEVVAVDMCVFGYVGMWVCVCACVCVCVCACVWV